MVFVDLAAGDLVAPEALLGYQALAGAATAFVAFGSHVDTQALAARAPRGATRSCRGAGSRRSFRN